MMISVKSIRLLVACVLVLGVCALSATRQTALAQTAPQQFCYAVADRENGSSTDTLVSLTLETAQTLLVGQTGTMGIEAIAMDPAVNTLYAANFGQLGTLDVNTGAFTALPEPFGTASGALGEVALADVDGLTVDPTIGTLYGTHRLENNQPDILFQINKQTGAHVPDAFDPGVDYVVIEGTNVLPDIDDIVVHPETGQMYGASNGGGTGGLLVTIDKATGAAAVVGPFGVDDIEGLGFSPAGVLYGSTGRFTTGPDTANRLYSINQTTGEAEFVAAFSAFTDYEALDCLTEGDPTSVTLANLAVSDRPGRAVAIALSGLALLGTVTLFFIRGSRQNGLS